LHGTTL